MAKAAHKLSTKSARARKKFEEAKHRRGAGGKFADKPGAGDDAPKKSKGGKTAGVKETDIIRVHAVGNPKKGTAAVRYAHYKDGMTVGDYIKAVGDRKQALRDMAWDRKQGWVSFEEKDPSSNRPPTVTESRPAAETINRDDYRVMDNEGDGAYAVWEQKVLPKDYGKQFTGARALEVQMKAAITDYTGSGAFKVNTYHRKGASKTPIPGVLSQGDIDAMTRLTHNLDLAFKNAPKLHENVVSWRGVSRESAPAFAKVLDNLEPGSKLNHPAYTSLTTKRQVAEGFSGGKWDPNEAMMMKVYTPKGSNVLPINQFSGHPSEREILAKRDQTLTYIGKNDKGEFEFFLEVEG